MSPAPKSSGFHFNLKWKILVIYLGLSALLLIFINVLWLFLVTPLLQDTTVSREVRAQLQAFALVISVVGLILSVLVNLWLSRFVTSWISTLQRGAETLASGKLSHRIEVVSNDEVGQLSRAFNSMAESLQRRSEEIERAKILAEGQKNQINSMLKSIADGVIALDFQGRILKVNPASETMFGWEENKVLGRELDEVLKISDGSEKIGFRQLLPNKPLEEDVVVTQRKSLKAEGHQGKTVFVDLVSSAIKEGRQLGLGAIITLTDVTREKEFEEMKLDFVSMAAHELRTPLTSVRGYLSVLLEELRKKLSPEQFSFLDKAFISSTQLAALVENLLSVSRIERGALEIQTQATDWQPLVEEAYNNFLPQAKERKVSLVVVKPEKKLPKVSIDKFRISEVVSNLVGNALNYTPEGGRVEISMEETPEEVITHIKDNGQGIPQNALPKLFTKFFRVSGVLEQGSKGTGLGLYISKAIVDMHKGKIWVESELGKGSIFSFSVPVAKNSLLRKVKIMSPGKKFFIRKGKTS